MARPIKKGLDYFSVDTDFLHNIKIRKIMRAHGPQAIAILIDLLGNIYGDEGYYMRWDDDARFLIADDIGISEGSVDELVGKSIKVGLFNSEMFKRYSILTSHGIQNRYKQASRKKENNEIDSKYNLLVSGDDNQVSGGNNSTSSEFPAEETGVSGAGNTQSKGNKSKGNKSKKDKAPKYGADSPYFQLAQFLIKRIKDNNPDHKDLTDAAMQKWSDTMRLMVERDGRTVKQIHNMIDWSQSNDFWLAVILSATNLRKNYDKMKAQANADSKKQSRNGGSQVKETLPDWATNTNQKIKKSAKLTPEQESSLAARLAKLEANKKEVNDA